MIKELVDFIDSQPKTVIVALFAVIVVGGVGGGVWIKTLISVAGTSDQRISLIKTQYEKANATMTEENLMLTEQLDILKNRMTDLSSKLETLSEDLSKVSTSDSIDASTVQLLVKNANILILESVAIEMAFKRADEMKVFAEKMRMAQLPDAAPPPSLLLPLIILVAVVVLVFIVWRVKRGSL